MGVCNLYYILLYIIIYNINNIIINSYYSSPRIAYVATCLNIEKQQMVQWYNGTMQIKLCFLANVGKSV